MLDFTEEQRLSRRGYKYVGGIDESGRGPLAGPVVAACAVCGPDFEMDKDKLGMIRDSKKLSAKKRKESLAVIYETFAAVGVGWCSHETIDRINILQATFLAMKKAIGALKQRPDFILLDGPWPIPNLSLPQKAIVNGDNMIFSIAAASIAAKVTRDEIMEQMHERYPEYGFNRHKGYGTKFHLEQLRRIGPSPVHRKSFAPIRRLI